VEQSTEGGSQNRRERFWTHEVRPQGGGQGWPPSIPPAKGEPRSGESIPPAKCARRASARDGCRAF
jgi:hypothetical protein